MEKQVRKEYTIQLKKRFSLISFIILLIHGNGFLASLLPFNTILAIIRQRKMKLNVIRDEDIEKKKYFLRHKDQLNKIILLSKREDLSFSEEMIKRIEFQIRLYRPPLDINEIYYYSLEDLKKLINNFNEEDFVQNKPIIITNLTQYREELKKGSTNFSLNWLNVKGEDIQSINLENLNLDINLRNVFVPFGGAMKYGNNFLEPLFSNSYYGGDEFLIIKDSKLGGNNVTGDLTPFKGTKKCKPVYFWYSEDTFDDNYKSQYPQFFLSKDAPADLREKFYNPKVVSVKAIDPYNPMHNSEYNYKEFKTVVRQTLTFDEYLKNYKFLKGKYLGNFFISEQDLKQIKTIEEYGLEKGKVILEKGETFLDDARNQTRYFIVDGIPKSSDMNKKHLTLSLKPGQKDGKKRTNT